MEYDTIYIDSVDDGKDSSGASVGNGSVDGLQNRRLLDESSVALSPSDDADKKVNFKTVGESAQSSDYCTCGLCEEGFVYSLESKQCEAVETKGCIFQNEDGSCLMCQSKHFMNEQGQCILNIQSELQNSKAILNPSTIIMVIVVILFTQI
jgi:hypothetical protein